MLDVFLNDTQSRVARWFWKILRNVFFPDHYENKIFDKQETPDADLAELVSETFLPE